MKELRGRMRGRRAFVVLTVYLALMGALTTLVYLAFATVATTPGGPSSRQAGKAVFAAVLSVQLFLVVFIGPAFTSGAISGEKERKTYDLLRTTLLSARSLVSGKLLSALSYVFLLIVVSMPLISIAFLLGGVSPVELLLSQLLVAVSAVTFALVGLFYSTMMRTTMAASVSTYATALLLTAGGPIVAVLFAAILGPLLFGPTSPAWPITLILIYAGLLLAATNLPATIVISEIFLLEQDALFFFTDLVDGRTVYFFAPWFVYVFLYTLLALVLFWVCVRRVKRIANK
jgi:ABC-type transport system involved in multi-copper enzyme maturation permease subunit